MEKRIGKTNKGNARVMP